MRWRIPRPPAAASAALILGLGALVPGSQAVDDLVTASSTRVAEVEPMLLEPVLGPPVPLAVSALGGDGRGRIENPGLPCDTGEGAYWHTDQVAALPAGGLTALPGELSLLLEVHSGTITRPQSVALPPPGSPVDPPTAFLPPGQSSVVLGDQRGTVRLDLAAAGTCEAPAILFDGRTAVGEVAWTVGDATGSYAGAVGDGTVAFAAAVEPGADNPWSVDLSGELAVPQPSLGATVEDVFWGNHGTDYLTRRVSVTYRLTNLGAGDAFGAVLTATSSPDAGVVPLGPHDVALGDVPAGASRTVTVRYQLGLLQPCGLLILACDFTTAVEVAWTDALDQPSEDGVAGLEVSAPALPPVLP